MKTTSARIRIEELYSCVAQEQLSQLPDVIWDARTVATCEEYYQRYIKPGTGERLPEVLFSDMPRWIFLEYLAKHCNVLLRGSADPALTWLEPLDPNLPGALPSHNIVGWDLPHIYAYSSSLIAMFFAILDRQRLSALAAIPLASTLYMPFEETKAQWREGFYFGVDYRALYSAPWREGTVYLFSSAHFVPQYRKIVWFSEQPVRPLAKLRIAPWEFPLLAQVNGLNWHASERGCGAVLKGMPWREDRQVHPLQHCRPLIEQVCAYLDTHYPENVSLTFLSSRVDMSPFKLLRLFRAIVGLSPAQYQTLLRITRAKHLLKTGASIVEAALDVGFVDQSHLTFHFKRFIGTTPGNYLRLQ